MFVRHLWIPIAVVLACFLGAKKRRLLRSGFRYLLCLHCWFREFVIWLQAWLREFWRVRNVRVAPRISVGGVRGVVAIDACGRFLCGTRAHCGERVAGIARLGFCSDRIC